MLPPIKDTIINQDSKSPAMSPPWKDPIPNQDSNVIINEQYPILLPNLTKYHTVYKIFFNDNHYPNKTEEEHNDSIDNSHTGADDYLN